MFNFKKKSVNDTVKSISKNKEEISTETLDEISKFLKSIATTRTLELYYKLNDERNKNNEQI